MATIGLRNQDEPNKPDKDGIVGTENPAYPSGVSPSRTMKTADRFGLRTILSGKVSFVSAHIVEGVRTSVAGAGTTPQYGLKRIWVETFGGEIRPGYAKDKVGMQCVCHQITGRLFNKRYTEECHNKNLTLLDHEELRVLARNENYYNKMVASTGYSRLIVLYLEQDDKIVDRFNVQCLHIDDKSKPLGFAYAQAIIGSKLDQLSFDQEQRYEEALKNSKLNCSRDWQEWNSSTDELKEAAVNEMLADFNHGATVGSIK